MERPRNNLNGQRDCGFTLVELLVVVAVIGVLAVFLLTAVSQAKRRARSAVCGSNLRQQGVMLASFSAQFDAFPAILPDKEWQKFPGQKASWVSAVFQDILPSIKPANGERAFRGILNCPSSPTDLSTFKKDMIFASYGYNAWGILSGNEMESLGLGRQGPGTNIVPVKPESIASPAGMFAFGDGVRGWGRRVQDSSGYIDLTKGVQENRVTILRVNARHSSRLNYGFVDGHVDSLPVGDCFSVTDPVSIRRWTRDNSPHNERF